MDHVPIAVIVSFLGALPWVAGAGFWLASKFNNIYKKMAEHELADEKRFNLLKAEIVGVMTQAQAIETFRVKNRYQD